MKVNVESEVLLRVFAQFIGLGQTELSKYLLKLWHRRDQQTYREFVQSSLPTQLTVYDLSELLSLFPSHHPSQIQWFLFSSHIPEHSHLRLKSEISASVESLLKASWMRQHVQAQDWRQVKEWLEMTSIDDIHLLRKEQDNIQRTLYRVAKQSIVLVGCLLQIFEKFVESLPAASMFWLQIFDRSLFHAIQQLIDDKESFVDHLPLLSGHDILAKDEYRPFIQKMLSSCTIASYLPLVEAFFSIPSPRLSSELQSVMDHFFSHYNNPEEVLFTENRVSWKWLEFPLARSQDWHIEGKKLEFLIQDITKNKFERLERWKRKNRRMIGLALIMGWDLLSTTSTFLMKKKVLDSAFSNLSSVHDPSASEFSFPWSALYMKLKFSELLAQILRQHQLHGLLQTSIKIDEGYFLTQMRSHPPQTLLENHLEYLDIDFLKALANSLMSIPIEDLSITITQDFQLILSSGILSCILAFFSLVSKLLDSNLVLPSQAIFISELSNLVSSIHLCLCGMQGTYLHAWLMSTITSIIILLSKKPNLLIHLSPTFLTQQKRRPESQSSHVYYQQQQQSSSVGMEALKAFQELLNVLEESTNQIVVERDGSGWEKEATQAHLKSFQVFFEDFQSALDFIIYSRTKNTRNMLCPSGWKCLGSFLALPRDAHALLRNMATDFSAEINTLLAWSEILDQNETLNAAQSIKAINSVLDVVISKKLTVQASLKLLKLALHYQYSSEEDASGVLLNRTMVQVTEILYSYLQRLKSHEELVTIDIMGKGLSSLSEKFHTQFADSRARKILEHLKAISRLREAVVEVESGRLRYLSGLLHNLSRALSEDISKLDSSAFLEIAGYGPDLTTIPRAKAESSIAVPYLSRMIDYLVDVGDIISTMDDGPSEGHNYFAMLKETPQELLTTLISHAQCAQDVENSAKVARVLKVDLVREILTSWITPIHYHPYEELKDFDVICPPKLPNEHAVKAFVALAPVRMLLFCALACKVKEDKGKSEMSGRMTSLFRSVMDEMFLNDKGGHYGALEKWLLIQEKSKLMKKDQQMMKISRFEKAEEIKAMMKKPSTLREALKLAERLFQDNIPDDLLLEAVEATKHFSTEDRARELFFVKNGDRSNPFDSVPISWIACMKVKNKSLALIAASERHQSWSIMHTIEFYSHLLDSMKQKQDENRMWLTGFLCRLKLYEKILQSPMKDEFKHWTEINTLYDEDCDKLVGRLLSHGAISHALTVIKQNDEISDHQKVSVYAAHVQDLSKGPASSGKGLLQALKFVKVLSPSKAFAVGMKVLRSAGCGPFSQVLVQYLLSLKSNLSANCFRQLEQTKCGIHALKCLPPQWCEKCAHLVEQPALIVESLIMAKQIALVKKMLEEYPLLGDDNLFLHYARKALGLSADKQALPSFLQEPDEEEKESKENRTISSYPSRASMILSTEGSPTTTGVSLVAIRVLSGVDSKDSEIRLEHACFKAIPDLTLFKVLMDLISSDQVAGAVAHRAVEDLSNAYLLHSCGDVAWNPALAQQFQELIDICLEVLDYAETKSQASVAENSTKSHKGLLYEPQYIYTTFSIYPGGPQTLWLRQEVPSTHTKDPNFILRVEIELLNKILTSGILSCLSELREEVQCHALLDRLIQAQQFHLAVQTARQCSIDERPYWEAWVTASIQEGNFLSARERVPYVFCIPSGLHMDNTRLRMEGREAAIRLVKVLESTCPVDMPAFFNLHNSLKYSRIGGMFRTSPKEMMRFMNRKKAPSLSSGLGAWDSPFIHERHGGPNADKATRKELLNLAASATLLEERIKFCEELLAAYAPLLLIEFMFRHGRGSIACQVMYPPDLARDSCSLGKSLLITPQRGISLEQNIAIDVAVQDDLGKSEIEISTSPSTSQIVTSESYRVVKESEHVQEMPSSVRRKLAKSHSLPHNQDKSSLASTTLPPWYSNQPQDSQNEPLIKGVNPLSLAHEIENTQQLCELAVHHQVVEDMVKAMLAGGYRGNRALTESCIWLERYGYYQHQYRCQEALGLLDAAGLTCLRLSWLTPHPEKALKYLRLARNHFEEALKKIEVVWMQFDDPKSQEELSIRLSRDQLNTLMARSNLQYSIYEELLLKPQGKDEKKEKLTPRKSTMFSEKEDESTAEEDKRKLNIVIKLLTRNFNLGFKVIFEFKITESVAYSQAIASMARSRKHKAILDLVKKMKEFVTEVQLDEILFHAIFAYKMRTPRHEAEDWTAWFAEGLVELMIRPRNKIKAFIQLQELESAYNVAAESRDPENIQLVLKASERAQKTLLSRKCEKILERVRASSSR